MLSLICLINLVNFFSQQISTQTTLRHTLGTRVLQDCIENREAIAYEIKEIIDEPASNWGVKVNIPVFFCFFLTFLILYEHSIG